MLEAGILKQSVSYDQVIDMQFVNQVRKELKRSISGEVSHRAGHFTPSKPPQQAAVTEFTGVLTRNRNITACKHAGRVLFKGADLNGTR